MDGKETEISFRPLSEGLGFHPFSDGLPYAPVTKTPQPKPRWNGDGATLAGTPRIARVAIPVAQTPAAAKPLAHQAVPAAELANPKDTAPLVVEEHFGFLYLSKRVLAFTFDTLLNTTLCALAFGTLFWRQKMDLQILTSLGAIILGLGFLLIFNWALITAQEVAFGTSAGKRVFGLVLPGSAGAVLLRSVLFAVSVVLLGAGLLWSLFDKRRRCWHDLAADLQPREAAQL